MNSNYVIIDNILSFANSQFIKDTLMQSSFPWGYSTGITKESNGEKDDYCFNHLFFNESPFIMSQSFSLLLQPILSQLKIDILFRAKANLYARTEKNVVHEWHVDRGDEHFSAIYYVNTNDGKTLIKDVAEIDSIQNRIVIFKGDLLHASTTSTDTKRVNINFNFYSRHKIEEMGFIKKENKISYK